MARVLAIDAGTTGVRAIIFAGDGSKLGHAYREIRMFYPRPGWAEQGLAEIWHKTQAVVSEVLLQAQLAPSAIDAIGITNQRSSIAAWEARDLRPLSQLVSWQDLRAADRAGELQTRGFFVMPNVSVSKPNGSCATLPRLQRSGCRYPTTWRMETWLTAKLTGGAHLCDHANASATGFYAYIEGNWDTALLDAVGISREWMPQIVECNGRLAITDADVFGAAVPIAALCGDQQASLFGMNCEALGATKCSYGTSAMVDASSGKSLSSAARARTLWSPGDWREMSADLVCRGSVITAGAAVQWLRDGLGLIRDAAQIGELASTVPIAAACGWFPPSRLGTPFSKSRARE